MTKKIAEPSVRIRRTNFQPQIIKPHELRLFAARKVKQLQMSKLKSHKISKALANTILRPKRSYLVQKEKFQEIISQSAFQCPVCLELMIEPTLLECGHAYCLKCIEELMIYKSNCGVCRNVQKEPQFQRSKYLQSLIEKVVLGKSSNILDFYCRLSDTQNWKRARNVSIGELNKGSLIDFRDNELKWRKAEITKIHYDELKCLHQIQVKYKRQRQNVEQTINSDSGRYAKFSYYTRMKYLEPRSHVQGLLTPSNEQVLSTPISSSFAEIEDGLGPYQGEDTFEQLDIRSQQNQSHGDSTFLPLFQEDEFLRQILQPVNSYTQQFIEILG